VCVDTGGRPGSELGHWGNGGGRSGGEEAAGGQGGGEPRAWQADGVRVVSEAGAGEAHEEGADHLLPLPERPAGAPALHGARAAPAPAPSPQR